MTGRQYLAAMGGGMLVLFIGISLLGQAWLSGQRLDFTENRLYSLSDGTRATLQGLSEPVQLTLVYTRTPGRALPAIQGYALRVREVLETYETLSRGKVRLTLLDPQPFSEAEDEALAKGLTAIDTGGGDPLYFGLIASNSVDQTRIIPFLSPERETGLEYELTRILQRLDQPAAPRIALLSSLPGIDAVTLEAGYALLQDLEASFTIDPVAPDFARLPDDTDVLFMVHPPPLSAWQLWQVEQFILAGGRALILLDPAAKTAPGTGPFGLTNRQIRSDLDPLTSAWGVTLERAARADSLTALAIEVETDAGRTEVVRHPLFLAIPPELMSQDSLITAGLKRGVNLAAPGSFRLDPAAPGRREILMRSGPAPAAIDPGQAALDLSAETTLDLYESSAGPAILAVHVTGLFDSIFPNGPPPLSLPDDPVAAEWLRAAQADAGQGLSRSPQPIGVILVADADMVEDSLYRVPADRAEFADNGAFLLNALDSLSGGSELMALRARAPGRRPMVRLDRLRDTARQAVRLEQAGLQARLQSREARLGELQALNTASDVRPGAGDTELSPAERVELDQLRRDIVETRRALRDIERRYRTDIDRLEALLRLFTVATGPVLMLALAGLLYWRRRRGA